MHALIYQVLKFQLWECVRERRDHRQLGLQAKQVAEPAVSYVEDVLVQQHQRYHEKSAGQAAKMKTLEEYLWEIEVSFILYLPTPHPRVTLILEHAVCKEAMTMEMVKHLQDCSCKMAL